MIPSGMSDRESDGSDAEEEEIDPRVQGELETLNGASSEINILETELEKSRNKFRSLLGESTQKLNGLFKKLGKVVVKARPYYALYEESKRAQAEAQKAAVNFQRSNSIYRAAKETVSLAEEKVITVEGDRREFDSAWQEMLNHATIKFMESETEKAKSEQEHLMKAAEYAAISSKLKFYEKDMPRSIGKARTYFELKEKLQLKLQMERQNVEDLQRALLCSKFKYKAALSNLEAISEEIHVRRKRRLQLPPRTPGVGAESISDLSDLPSIKLDNLSDTCSFVSMDDLEADGASLRDLDLSEYEKRAYAAQPNLQSEIDLDLSALELAAKVKAVDMRNDFMSKRMAPLGIKETDGAKRNGNGKHRVVSPAESEPAKTADTRTSHVVSDVKPLAGDNSTQSADKPTKPADTSLGNEVTSTKVTQNTVFQNDADSAQGQMSPECQRDAATAERQSRKREKKLQTQQAFPMLAGLSQLHRKQSPTQISRASITLKTQMPMPAVLPPSGRSVVHIRRSATEPQRPVPPGGHTVTLGE